MMSANAIPLFYRLQILPCCRGRLVTQAAQKFQCTSFTFFFVLFVIVGTVLRSSYCNRLYCFFFAHKITHLTGKPLNLSCMWFRTSPSAFNILSAGIRCVPVSVGHSLSIEVYSRGTFQACVGLFPLPRLRPWLFVASGLRVCLSPVTTATPSLLLLLFPGMWPFFLNAFQFMKF